MEEHKKAMNLLEELRLTMKKIHKKDESPYRRSEFQAMLLILEKKDLTMQRLGEELGVTKSRVTAIVTELQNKGFVEQSFDKKDKRKKVLKLTPKAEEYMKERWENYENWFKRFWSKLDKEEKDAVELSLKKINEIMLEELQEQLQE
ncbi:MarR family winged helix-turn-helix transcriptional regulator [Gemella cuniculi]|uniref:MarR family winged helix-turn-helix transcriptional regulator n=1 Tax=Gemella cuniculi TaxID=150240 RepID=UPI0004231A3F|nr:MarR family transcriptional regulator [Gemella cuniculi]